MDHKRTPIFPHMKAELLDIDATWSLAIRPALNAKSRPRNSQDQDRRSPGHDPGFGGRLGGGGEGSEELMWVGPASS